MRYIALASCPTFVIDITAVTYAPAVVVVDPTQLDSSGMSAIDYARDGGHGFCLAVINNPTQVEGAGRKYTPCR